MINFLGIMICDRRPNNIIDINYVIILGNNNKKEEECQKTEK